MVTSYIYTIHPWITQVWTAQIHSNMDFFPTNRVPVFWLCISLTKYGESFCLISNHNRHACAFSWVQLCATLRTIAHQDPLTMEFSEQEYWSGLPSLPPGDLPSSQMNQNCISCISCFGRWVLTTEPPQHNEGCIQQALSQYHAQNVNSENPFL